MSGSHIVEKGETLSGIAEKYRLKLDDLIRWNELDNPDLIQPGQEIELSGHEAPGVYVVQAGDTLKAIAAQHGLELADLIEWNDLDNPDLIHPGQEIKLTGDQV